MRTEPELCAGRAGFSEYTTSVRVDRVSVSADEGSVSVNGGSISANGDDLVTGGESLVRTDSVLVSTESLMVRTEGAVRRALLPLVPIEDGILVPIGNGVFAQSIQSVI